MLKIYYGKNNKSCEDKEYRVRMSNVTTIVATIAILPSDQTIVVYRQRYSIKKPYVTCSIMLFFLQFLVAGLRVFTITHSCYAMPSAAVCIQYRIRKITTLVIKTIQQAKQQYINTFNKLS